MSKPETSRNVLLVGAIDFGTTYSGWAYSFQHDYKSDPTRATVQHWYSGSSTLVTEKTPTVPLIAPDGKTLVDFGYEAENRYKELVENDEHENYYYFRRFKMALNKEVSAGAACKLVFLKDFLHQSLTVSNVRAIVRSLFNVCFS